MNQSWKAYDIIFSRLSQDQDSLRFEIDENFFKLFDYEEEFDQPKINIFVDVEKVHNFFSSILMCKAAWFWFVILL